MPRATVTHVPAGPRRVELVVILGALIGLAALVTWRVAGTPALGVLALFLLPMLVVLPRLFLPALRLREDGLCAGALPLCLPRRIAWNEVADLRGGDDGAPLRILLRSGEDVRVALTLTPTRFLALRETILQRRAGSVFA